MVGTSALMFTALPMVLIATNYGKWIGLMGAITAIAFNTLLVFTFSDTTWREWVKGGEAGGHLALVCLVLLVGWLMDTSRKFSESARALVEANDGMLRLSEENEELAAISRSSFIAEKDQAVEIAVIDEVSKIVSSTRDLEVVYHRFFDQLKKVVSFDLALIALFNQKSGRFEASFVTNPGRGSYQKGDPVDLAGADLSRGTEDRSTVVIDDLADLGEFRSLMRTPLVSNDEVIGGLVLFGRQSKSFGQRETAIVDRLSGQISRAVRRHMAIKREEQLVIALDSIGEAVAFLDENSVYQHVNRAFEDLYGYTEDEIRGQPMTVVPVRDTETGAESNEFIEQAISSGWSGEVVRRGKSGELLDILLTVAPVTADNGEVIGHINISRNITERKRTEASLNETSRLASVGELAAGVAHEINNPLTSILLCAEFLADSDLPEEALADLSTISQSALRASKIVQNLLLFARHKGWNPSLLPMTSVLERAIELKSYDFKIRMIKVDMEADTDVPRSMIDDHQMTQVIINVLYNAGQVLIAYKGGGNIGIRISVEDGEVLTAISDDGPGISAEVLPKIFDPFFTTKSVGEGTGLGLSICYGIVRQHGGEMWAESALHKGTTIYIRIPAAGEDASGPVPGDGPADDISDADSILVVDDEFSIREMISKGLTNEFDQIDLAESGEEALEKVEVGDYSCILLDLRLNGIGGPEVYRRIADRDQETADKIIFITGDTASPATSSFLSTVGNTVIPKPFTLKQVRDSISAIR